MLSQQLEYRSDCNLVVRGKALIVDPVREDREAYARLFGRLGFDVKPCVDYLEGKRYLDTVAPDFVIVNQGTAAFEGRWLVARALERDRHTPVVVLAQSLNMESYLEAMQLGAVDYLEKPVVPMEMERLVRTHSRLPIAALACAH
jgi:DNA-binding NtrC family response regulator